MSNRSQWALLGALSLIAGCAAPAEAAPEAKPAAKQPVLDEMLHEVDTAAQPLPSPTSALGRVLGSSELRACVRSDVPPFGSFSANGLEGFDVALASEIANQISIYYKHALKMEWIVVTAGEHMKRLQAGACDILVAAFSQTTERAAQIATSKIYLQTDKVLLAATKQTRRVPVIGKIGGAPADLKAPEPRATERAFNTYQEVIRAMDGEEIDYLVTDRPIAEQLIRSTTKGYKIAKTIAERAESYVVGVRNGSADLEAAVNRALDDLARTGRIALLHRRWL